MFKAEQTHSGQYRPYGDSFYEWDIQTDETKEEVLKKCFDLLRSHGYGMSLSLPEKSEWKKNVRHGGPLQYDYGYYFAGYYELKKIENGYHFTVCEPFAD